MTEKKCVLKSAVSQAIGHFSTSAKLLTEALRYNADLKEPNVLDNVASVLGEQNALERIDLTPEKISVLPDWEQKLANEALERSRQLRFKVSTAENISDLQKLAIETEEYFKYLNREWASKRLETCVTHQEESVEAPKSKLGDYGRSVSEARQRLLAEIQQSMHKPKEE